MVARSSVVSFCYLHGCFGLTGVKIGGKKEKKSDNLRVVEPHVRSLSCDVFEAAGDAGFDGVRPVQDQV